MVDFNQFLDFERPVVELEEEIARLKVRVEGGDLSLVDEVVKIEKKLDRVRTEIYSNLTAYQRVRLSRHFERPFTMDYINRFISNFVELHGDRLFGDDAAIIGGIGEFNSSPIVVIGHQRGRSTQDRLKRNFGMCQPEGNRKAQRLFKLAEKFSLPLLLLIDTQGAYPGLEAEARGQAESIAQNLKILSGLKTRIVSVVIGEGGSGGALALGVCDKLLMLENSTFSVISPEACVAILWGKSDIENLGDYFETASEGLKLTAKSLAEFGIVDEIVKEPPGGAHRDPDRAAELLAESITKHLHELSQLTIEELRENRYQKFRTLGAFQ